MTCNDIRKALAQAFDEGLPPSTDLSVHLCECPDCRAYAERLKALDGFLHTLPLEAMRPELADAAWHAVALKPSRAERVEPVLVAGVAVVLTALLVWYFPVLENARACWLWLAAFVPEAQFRPDWSTLQGYADQLWNTLRMPLSQHIPVSTTILWTCAAAGLALLIGINGWAARHLDDALSNRSLRTRRIDS